jgi:hypothetical protein
VALALVQIPDAPQEVAILRPEQAQTTEIATLAQGRDVLLVGAPTLALRSDGLPVVDPRSKAVALVESGELRVDGVVTDPPSQRWVDATRAWERADVRELEHLGVGVIVDGSTVTETAAGPRRGWRFQLGLGLTTMWMLVPLALLIRRRSRSATGAG